MNRFFLALVAISFSVSAFSAPIYCKKGPWSAIVNSKHDAATIKKNGKSVQFGKLRCFNVFTAEVRPEGSPVVQCFTPNVADAGYNLYLYRPHGKHRLNGELSTVTFAGAHKVAFFGDKDCVQALHRGRPQ